MNPDNDVDILKAIRRKVLAAMETGQTGQARTVVTELEEVNAEQAAVIRADVAATYGIFL